METILIAKNNDCDDMAIGFVESDDFRPLRDATVLFNALIEHLPGVTMTELYRQGWEEVPTARHPEEMPLQGNHPVIERKGMVLMERPKDITDEVRLNDRRAARRAIQAKEEQLGQAPQGQFNRDHPTIKPRVKKSYEPMPVPE